MASARLIPTLLLMFGIPLIAATPSWITQPGNSFLRDPAGNTYIVGSVTSDVVPFTAGAFQTHFNSAVCGYSPYTAPFPCPHGFAAKISADGSKVLYATYIGGSGDDRASAVGVDASGNLFILVSSSSPDFPVTGSIAGLPPPTNASDHIVELTPDGSRLLFSYSYAFPGCCGGEGMAVLRHDGVLIFAGTTDGTAFPTTPGAYLRARPNVSLDGYVVEWDPQTNTIVHSTLIGGSDQDKVSAVTVDDSGNVYVAGYTISRDFPVTPGAFFSPGTDATQVNDFVVKLDSTLSTLEFSAFFGGSFHPIPNAIAVDSAGAIYIAGSGSRDLPVSPGAFETSFTNGFLAKIDGNSGTRLYLTYLGDGNGIPGQIVPSGDGSVWVSGSTASGGVVTTPDALEPALSNIFTSPAYLKHIATDGTHQLYGTYLAEMMWLAAPGVALVTDATNLFRSYDFNSPPPAKSPVISSIVNAASLGQPDFIAPGEIVSIFGLSIGPDQPASYKLDSGGRVSSSLNGLQVVIDGIPAPVLYESKNQINAVVPFEVVKQSGDGSAFGDAMIQVQNPGGAAALSILATKVSSLPGIFAILNQDATPNSAQNPAMQGSVISLFVTGLGAMTPVPGDGTVASGASSKPVLPIQVFVGTGPASLYKQLDGGAVLYVGEAPGQIEGLQQINVQLPVGAAYSDLYIRAGAGISSPVALFEQ